MYYNNSSSQIMCGTEYFQEYYESYERGCNKMGDLIFVNKYPIINLSKTIMRHTTVFHIPVKSETIPDNIRDANEFVRNFRTGKQHSNAPSKCCLSRS